jgi:hypothetical protein
MEQLQSYMRLTTSPNICAFPHVLGSRSSYMTSQLVHSVFPMRKIFHQCIVHTSVLIIFSSISIQLNSSGGPGAVRGSGREVGQLQGVLRDHG